MADLLEALQFLLGGFAFLFGLECLRSAVMLLRGFKLKAYWNLTEQKNVWYWSRRW